MKEVKPCPPDEYFDCVNNWWSGFVGKETCEAGYLVCKGEECDRYTPEKKQKKQTNADQIRKMTDEELTRWRLGDMCPPHRYPGDYECVDMTCEGCWLDWLKQEAKDAAD